MSLALQSHAIVDSYTLRRLSASAVRFRLGRQLDWRLDLMLDATGLHLLSLRGLYALRATGETQTLFSVVVDDEGIKQISEMTESPWEDAEIVVRTEALLKIPHTQTPLEVPLDLRLRDYAALPSPDVDRIERERGVVHTGRRRVVEMNIRGKDFIPDADTVVPSSAAEKRIHEAAPAHRRPGRTFFVEGDN